MKLKTIFLIIACIVLIGCGLMKPSLPPPEKISAALDKIVKKENPNAYQSITATKPNENGTGNYFAVEFKFTNFDFTDAAEKKRSLASGRANANINYENGIWTITTIWITEPEKTVLTVNIPIEK